MYDSCNETWRITQLDNCLYFRNGAPFFIECKSSEHWVVKQIDRSGTGYPLVSGDATSHSTSPRKSSSNSTVQPSGSCSSASSEASAALPSNSHVPASCRSANSTASSSYPSATSPSPCYCLFPSPFVLRHLPRSCIPLLDLFHQSPFLFLSPQQTLILHIREVLTGALPKWI